MLAENAVFLLTVNMEAMIEHYCKKLKIGKVFYRDYKHIKASSHEAFLLELLKREFENREIVRKNRLLRAANFDVVKLLKNMILVIFKYHQLSQSRILPPPNS